MDEEILIDKDNDIEYLKRLVSQNTFLIILIVIIIISALVFWTYLFMDDSRINDYSCAVTQMGPKEIEDFNSQFTIYAESQIGNKLKSMLGTLIANANTYSNEPEKIPTVIVKDDNKIIYVASFIKLAGEDSKDMVEPYINYIAFIRNNIINKSYYNVEFKYSEDGLVNEIIITGTINGLNGKE